MKTLRTFSEANPQPGDREAIRASHPLGGPFGRSIHQCGEDGELLLSGEDVHGAALHRRCLERWAFVVRDMS
jgi:hypothetical protein